MGMATFGRFSNIFNEVFTCSWLSGRVRPFVYEVCYLRMPFLPLLEGGEEREIEAMCEGVYVYGGDRGGSELGGFFQAKCDYAWKSGKHILIASIWQLCI